ncbi:MAG: hypothetical protein V1722_03940 [Candidatus Micrarchaeota archaeon]
MNLNPMTVILLLILAFFFYSQGYVFFFFITLAIGFILLLTSAVSPSYSSSSAHHDCEGHSSSVYPEKMQIQVTGTPPEFYGPNEFSEGMASTIDFAGRLIGKLLPKHEPIEDEPEKKK